MLWITLAPIISVILMAAIAITTVIIYGNDHIICEREKMRADSEKERADLAEERARFTDTLLVERITRAENAFLEAGFEREKGKKDETN